MEARDFSKSWQFRNQQPDGAQLSNRKPFGMLAKNPGSLPVMGVAVSTIDLNRSNVDVNANMLPPLSQAFSATSAPHIAPRTPPTLPRRQEVVLPRRYLLRLKEYRKQKQTTSGTRPDVIVAAHRQQANGTILEETDPVDLDKTLSDADLDNIFKEVNQEANLNVSGNNDIVEDGNPGNPEITITPAAGDNCEGSDSEEDTDTLKKSDLVSNNWSDRLSDLDTAEKWIRQERLQIKHEDRLLITRLLDLRARIHQLQGRPSHMSLSTHLSGIGSTSCGSNINVGSWASFISLDERALEQQASECPEYLKDVVASFRDRPDPGYGHARLAGYGAGVLPEAGLYRSTSSREAIRPSRISCRKKSLPMANELDEAPYYDDDDDDEDDDLDDDLDDHVTVSKM